MISSRMSEEEEREHIASTLEQIERATGRRPRGWIGQDFGESTRTPALVAEQGLSYISDWPNDDQPYRMLPAGGLVSLPQHAQWDDVLLLWVRQVSSTRYPDLVQSACDALLEEGTGATRMLGLGVHPWLSGQAHRIKYLRQAIADVMARPGVWHADGQSIADHYIRWLGQAPEKEEE
jgi:peptidoglycan/xylan/chitin deacetylase (PgdA/CDA1 family)